VYQTSLFLPLSVHQTSLIIVCGEYQTSPLSFEKLERVSDLPTFYPSVHQTSLFFD
jgi:hypothetical protein